MKLTRKFKIAYDNRISKWVLYLNGYELKHFKYWKYAIDYLVQHWFCECTSV